MLRFIAWRLVQLPLILAVIFTVTFVMAWMVPGDPLQKPEGQRPPPEVQEAMKRQYNLHSPWAFAGAYLKNVLTRGDFGPSLYYAGESVNDIIGQGLRVSVKLGLAALVVALLIGVTAGMIGALRPGSLLDLSSLAVALLGVSLPSFVTGTVLLVLGSMLNLPRVGGWGHPSDIILPALTLGAAPAAYIARLIRLGLADVMSRDFIRTARAKGVGPLRLLFKHALKVAFLPVLSFLGPAAAAVMTGSFVVEKVFAIPGLGEHFVNAVRNKDQFLILGIVLTYGTMLVTFNLLVDVAYAWIDPRIELMK